MAIKQKRTGELLVKRKVITEEQLVEALELQRLFPEQTIGQLLCTLGYIKHSELGYILEQIGKRRKLKEVLLENGFVNEEQISHAESYSKEKGISLSTALITLNYLDDDKLAQTFSLQYELPVVKLDAISIEDELGKFINASYARRHKIVPVSRVGAVVTLAMAYPMPFEDFKHLERVSGVTILPVIATESDLLRAQQRLYKTGAVQEGEIKQDLPLEVVEDSHAEQPSANYGIETIGKEADFIVKKIIAVGIGARASDIHLESHANGMELRFRIDGVLQKLTLGESEYAIMSNAKQIISKIKILSEMDIAERRRPQDGSFKMKIQTDNAIRIIDFRVATNLSIYGENMVVRILDKRSISQDFDSLGLPEDIRGNLTAALAKPTGIYLATGPTGSGKSSTLYAILSKMNQPGVKIMTVEDPVEFTIDGVAQSEVSDIIGNTFARYVRSFMRHDPDIIMVGEIRDFETAEASVRASLTGHTVLSTLHTNDSTSAVPRMVDMGVNPNLLASTIRGVMAQRLVRRICRHCREQYDPGTALLKDFFIDSKPSFQFYRGKGCPQCHFTGFSGRKPIMELWLPTKEESLLIGKRLDTVSLRHEVFLNTARRTMLEEGIRLVTNGETTLDELVRVVPYEQISELGEKLLAGRFSWEAVSETAVPPLTAQT
jgi:type II secretory ATPase GspE/PulE/Tfp pilus assembly ATPase PilB-like protein